MEIICLKLNEPMEFRVISPREPSVSFLHHHGTFEIEKCGSAIINEEEFHGWIVNVTVTSMGSGFIVIENQSIWFTTCRILGSVV